MHFLVPLNPLIFTPYLIHETPSSLSSHLLRYFILLYELLIWEYHGRLYYDQENHLPEKYGRFFRNPSRFSAQSYASGKVLTGKNLTKYSKKPSLHLSNDIIE